MRVEIINKPMLCWNNDENDARECHVLAKVTECAARYPYKVIYNKNTYPQNPEHKAGTWDEAESLGLRGFKHAKPLPETIELTVADISKLLGKTVKIIG